MFALETKKPLQAAGSPSYLPNNLSSSPTGALTYVKVNDVYLVKANSESLRLPIARCKVYQSKFVQVQKRTMIAIMSDLGVQIWSADGDNMLFYYALASLLGTQYEDGRFMRGATGQDTALCVGCSNGAIVVFDCSNDLSRGNFPLLHSLETKGHAIYELSSSPSFLTAADDVGNIFAYRLDSAFELAFSIPSLGHPCVSMFSTEYAIIAGYTSGHVRVFRTDTREMAIEITAHARMVSGLAFNDNLQLAASCSPDQYLHVWTVPNFRSQANSSMDCMFTHHLDNRLCTGAAFLSEQRLAVVCYDEDEIVTFNRV